MGPTHFLEGGHLPKLATGRTVNLSNKINQMLCLLSLLWHSSINQHYSKLPILNYMSHWIFSKHTAAASVGGILSGLHTNRKHLHKKRGTIPAFDCSLQGSGRTPIPQGGDGVGCNGKGRQHLYCTTHRTSNPLRHPAGGIKTDLPAYWHPIQCSVCSLKSFILHPTNLGISSFRR